MLDNDRARSLVWDRFPSLVLFSVYTSKNSTALEFRDFLVDLEEAIRAVLPGIGVVIGRTLMRISLVGLPDYRLEVPGGLMVAPV